MEIRKFVNRHDELDALERASSEKGFKLHPVYGRRRIGKTALLKRFMSDRTGMYFLCTGAGAETVLERLATAASAHLGVPPMNARGFGDVFANMVKMGFTKGVLVLDEFPALIQSEPGLMGEFQYIVDEILRPTDIMLILCGSSIGMMENYVLSSKSPLYGRRTGQLQVGPIRDADIMGFLPDFNFRQRLTIQAMVGGVPRYLEEFSGRKSIEDVLARSYFSSDGYLYREGYILLRDELREPDTYSTIIESIAAGNAKLTEIANASHIPAKDMPKYLNVLDRLGIVAREHAVTDRRPNTKKSLYVINDDYYRFYFRYVVPNRGHIEFQEPDVPLADFEKTANEYMSVFWERYVVRLARDRLGFARAGRWWHGGEELDLVAIDDRNERILFGEAKWTGRKADRSVVDSLMAKTELVRGYEKYRKSILVASMGGFDKRAISMMDDEGIVHLDLHDVERLVHRGPGGMSSLKDLTRAK